MKTLTFATVTGFLLILALCDCIQKGTSIGFTILPSEQVVTEGDLATFRCQHSDTSNIFWLLNETSLNMFDSREVTTASSGHPRVYFLYINAHTEYNRSSVECVATFGSGSLIQITPSVKLYVQGPLNSVSDLSADVQNSVLYITWSAPFTLNLTNTEPDITYCIQIFNNSNEFQILHTCNHTETEFFHHLQQNVSLCCVSDDCSIIVTVVPTNGAGSGSSAQLYIPLHNDETTIRSIETLVNMTNSRSMEAIFSMEPMGPTCECSLLLWNMQDTKYYVFNVSNGLKCGYSTISLEFSADMLPFNSHYKGNISIFSSSFSINISTHDVQNIWTDEVDLNTVHLTATFINNSRAKGALVVLIPDLHAGLTVNELQSTLSFIIPNPSETTISTLVSKDVPSGTYKILVYDIEENGLLNVPSAMPAVISTVTTHGRATLTESKSNKPQEVNITANIFKSFLIINCTYVNEDKIQGCLVVLSSRFSPEQLHVQIQLRDSAFPLVYYVKPNTRHTIAGFAIKEDSGILNSTINSMDIYIGFDRKITAGYRIDSNAYITALGASISISIIIIIVLSTILIIKFCVTNSTQTKRKSDRNKPSTIQMQKCEAYEVLPIRRH